ncbi:MAG: DNA translocase FtsK [Haliscomenobacter sp.]|nr:DNA translocase FtsK [Haliscomenobacter sp.]MBP9075542.1 DNA translocase FtsK [Haliscomenobacter sp.]
MAAKGRRKRAQLALKLDINDERIPKLVGVVFLFFAFYFFIAFTSYLFTWRVDQDRVIRFSWELLLRSDFEMANWLGRLGAIVSNFFFYYLFGLPSYLIIYIMVLLGFGFIRRAPLSVYWLRIRYALVIMLSLAVLLEFLFPGAAFSWGGGVGEMINQWLYRFVGAAGMIVFFLAILAGMLIWFRNPSFTDLTPAQAWDELKGAVDDLLHGRWVVRKRPTQRLEDEGVLLRPKRVPADPQDKAIKGDGEGGSQLSFDLVKDAQVIRGLPPLGPNAELEISAPPPGPTLDKPALPPVAGVSAIGAEEEHFSEPYDPTLELSSYEYPVVALLNDYSDQKVEIDREELETHKDQIIETLLHYKIEITKIRATIGPTVTLYEIVPAPGVRISRIKNLEDDIALSLAALGIRIIAPIPGKGTIGIEVPNKKKQVVSMKEVLMSDKFKRAKMDLPIVLGKTITNEVFVADLTKMPHLLVAGATGQGKSVGINAILMSILYKKHPSQVKLVLVDPKKVELSPYSTLEHHFLAFLPNQDEPIITDTTKVIHTLNSLCIEMDSRYDLLKKASARNIREYNDKFVERRLNPNKGHRFLPFIVLVIDEFADLIMTAGKEVELPIGRLAQLSRAVGIHLVLATQRPSVNIITGIIKANFPARIAYKVSSKVDSRTILDGGGADQLIGRGDMLLSIGGETIRLQGAFIDTPEVEHVVDFIAKQPGYPEPYFLPEFHGEDDLPGAVDLKYSDLDEFFEDAARLIVQNQHGSTSMIQRRLKLGYNRAGRIMDQLEAMGIVGPSEGSKPREVLIYDESELERYLDDLRKRK